jgi:GT2 family glycosyltransferase
MWIGNLTVDQPNFRCSSREILVVIVAYGAPQLLEKCLSSLEGCFTVFVVDNSSDVQIHDLVLKAGANYIDSRANIGFAAGVNVALANISGTVPICNVDILLLNPDAFIGPTDIRRLQERLHCGRRLACVGPALVDPFGRTREDRLQPFRSPLRALLEAGALGAIRSSNGYLCGAVMLLNGIALLEVGGLDERFFLYAEEMDWQRRANQLGWKSMLCHEISAVHVVGGTETDPNRRNLRLAVGIERYVRKHYGSLGWIVYRWAMVLAQTRRFIVRRGEARRSAAQQIRILVRDPERAARKAGVVPRTWHEVPHFAIETTACNESS